MDRPYSARTPSTKAEAWYEWLIGMSFLLMLGLAPVLALANGAIGAVLGLPLTYVCFVFLKVAFREGRSKTRNEMTQEIRRENTL